MNVEDKYAARLLKMFRMGNDTVEIAIAERLGESEVYNLMGKARKSK